MLNTEAAIKYYFKDNKARLSPETVRCYGISLSQFFDFCQKEFNEVKGFDIRAWLARLDELKLKPRSVYIKIVSVRNFYRYCLEENLIQKDPTLNIEAPQIEDSLPQYLDKVQLAELMELAKDDLRERALIETLYATGVRVSELTSIELIKIKWEDRLIWIKGKNDTERFVIFSAECEERLKAYLNNRGVESPYLFCNKWGGPLTRVWIELIFRNYSQRLGFRVTPHTLRHTFAAHLAEKDMPQSYIQELLGHININTTRIYTRLNSKARKTKYDSYVD